MKQTHFKRILSLLLSLLLLLLALSSCSALVDSVRDALRSELGEQTTKEESRQDDPVSVYPSALTNGSPTPEALTSGHSPTAVSTPTPGGAESLPDDPTVQTPTPVVSTPSPVSSPSPASSPSPTPSPDGIPYKTMPEFPPYVMPEESFSSDLEREAAGLIDGAIAQAISLVSVMKDDRHSFVTCPFEEDSNGYIAELSDAQKKLYRTLETYAESFERFSIDASDYGGDLLSDALDLAKPLSNCRPDLTCYFTFAPTGMLSGIKDKYFDPERDSGASVNNGEITLEEVRRRAQLLDAVVKRIVKKMPEGLSAYDRYYYLASVICAKNAYTGKVENCFTAYGALITGGSVCEGYARAFWLLCREANLWCAYRVGIPSGEGHVWNMIRLEDGIYNVDVTWCDARTPGSKNWYAYFVKSDEAFVKDGHAANGGVKGTGGYEPNPYEG